MSVERVIWINPSGTDFAGTSAGAFAEGIKDRAQLTMKGLEVWGLTAGGPYDMGVEVNAVSRVAQGAGLSQYHLFGFSAGGTVALAAALALGDAILSVAVLEPAYIGDDDWSPAEADWRSRMRALRSLPPQERTAGFRQLMMRPGEPAPPPRNPPTWDAKDEMLEEMLVGNTGFTSGDLAAIGTPTLVITGGRSHPRWAHVAERMTTVIPDAEAAVFPDLHHFTPPFREHPARCADLLTSFWARARQAGPGPA